MNRLMKAQFAISLAWFTDLKQNHKLCDVHGSDPATVVSADLIKGENSVTPFLSSTVQCPFMKDPGLTKDSMPLCLTASISVLQLSGTCGECHDKSALMTE